jgi:glucose/arabinose dehydrogenase
MKLQMNMPTGILILVLILLAAGSIFLPRPNSASAGYESAGQKFSIELLAERQDVIWGFDFLPDGRIVFTEREGRVGVLDPRTKAVQAIAGIPAVARQGQGGLLDVRVHPDFSKNREIYLTYSEYTGGNMTTALGRGRLEGTELKDYRKLFSVFEPSSERIHFGSRIEFDGAGHLFMSMGERNDRDKAQKLGYHNGKILRLNQDGSVPADNPFVKDPTAKPEIWSYGHRNPQGLARHPTTGELWSAEYGPRGGDEINLIRAGANYGWPVITYGREYYGPKIGEGTEKPGMEQPAVYWVPSISPSGIGFYSGDKFPRWKGDLFVAALTGQHIRRLSIDDGKVVGQEPLLGDLGWRFRHVRQGPDSFLYFSTDEGRLGRLVPER